MAAAATTTDDCRKLLKSRFWLPHNHSLNLLDAAIPFNLTASSLELGCEAGIYLPVFAVRLPLYYLLKD